MHNLTKPGFISSAMFYNGESATDDIKKASCAVNKYFFLQAGCSTSQVCYQYYIHYASSIWDPPKSKLAYKYST